MENTRDVMEIHDILKRVFINNEIGGNEDLIYRFSDADGIHTGKSGYSFGICQFDIENNWDAIECLRDCDFTPKEVSDLYNGCDVVFMDKKLLKHKSVIDCYDNLQINKCLMHCSKLLVSSDIKFTTEGLLAVADYHNQFYFSPQGKLHKWLLETHIEATAASISKFKLTHTLWGRNKPQDVSRRQDGIIEAMDAGGY